MTEAVKQDSIKKIAQAGLISKGIVYVLIGFLAFTAAFRLGKSSNDEVSQDSAFSFIEDLPAGQVLLFILAAGLLCYSVWRMIQAFRKSHGEEVKMAKRLRYFFSGLAYLALTFTVVRFALHQGDNGGDKNQAMAADLMSKPYGSWLVIIGGLIFAAVGIYQIYYGLSEKYKKHVQSFGHHSGTSLLVTSGKIGYVARGIVWLLISYMLTNAGLHHNSSEAGSTDKAFKLLENIPMGPYFAGAVGLGLIAYGIFNFIRAKYDRFNA